MPRQFSTPILLPGPPTLDLHAATKKYVDDNAGGSASADLPEASTSAYTAPVAATALLGRTTRYNTTSGDIAQPLPAATPGRVFRYGWDGGAGALTFVAASGDFIGGGSATVITAPSVRGIQTWRCTFTGRWRLVDGYSEQDTLDARYMFKDPSTIGGAWGALGDGGPSQSIPATTWTPITPSSIQWANGVALSSGGVLTFDRVGVYLVLANAWLGTAGTQTQSSFRALTLSPSGSSTRFTYDRKTVPNNDPDVTLSINYMLRVTDTSIGYTPMLYSAVGPLPLTARSVSVARQGNI